MPHELEPGGPTSGGLDAADLLRAARETLAAEIVPALTGRQRYAALMAANALGMVERGLLQDERLRAADRALAEAAGLDGQSRAAVAGGLRAAIRLGRHDGDQRLHRALHARAVEMVSITHPDVLSAAAGARERDGTDQGETINGS